MLLKLYNLEHTLIGGLQNCKDLKVESVLSGGDKTLSFLWHQRNRLKIPQEYYIRTDTDEYVVKENSKGSNGYRNIVANLNLEDLEGRIWMEYAIEGNTAQEAADYALTGTGWSCISTVPEERLRNISMKKTTSLRLLQKILEAFTCEIRYDTLTKTVYLMERVGEDKGAYFIPGINLKELTEKGDSYGYATRMIPIGADGLTIASVNDGVEYLENYQYSDKIKTIIWEDTNYTDAQALKEDAAYKLNGLSKPRRSLSVKVIDLSKIKPEYSVLSYSVGDTVTIISNGDDINEKQRITKTVEYPNEPEKNTCEISNTILSFEAMQKKLFAAAECIGNVTTDNGTINGSKVDSIDVTQIIGLERYISEDVNDLKVDTLYVRTEFGAPSAIIGELTGTNANITNLQVSREDVAVSYVTELHADTTYGNYAKYTTVEADNISALEERVNNFFATNITTEYLEANYASIGNVKATYATIAQLNATNVNVDTLQANVGDIRTLMFGSAAGDTITTQFSNSIVAQVGESQIKSAMIQNLDVSKLLAGDISTNKFRILSDSGRMLLSDNTMQISDDTRTRVQIGKDATGDYNMAVWDAAGNLMFDALGATENAIQRQIIRDDMVKDDANINAKKLDIQSLFTEMNNSTETLKASKVQLDTQAQTLDVAFTTLSTTADSALSTATSTAMAFDGLEIGGRNLYIGTKDFSGSKWINMSGYSVDGSYNGFTVMKRTLPWGGLYQNINAIAGETYTLSAYIKTDGKIYFFPDKTAGVAGILISGTSASEFKKISITFKIDKTGTFAPRFENGLNNTSMWICCFKLERGDKATDWTPAPEDIENTVSALSETVTMQGTSISTIQGQITSKIWQTDIDTASATLSQQYSTLSQDLSGFKTTVSSTYATKTALSSTQSTVTQNSNKIGWLVASGTSASNFTLTDRTATLIANYINLNGLVTFSGLGSDAQSKISTAQSTANTANTTATTAVNSINNLKIGGRNLIQNTATAKTLAASTNNYNFANYAIITGALEVGEYYTVSADIEVLAGTVTQVSVGVFNSALTSSEWLNWNMSINNGRITGTLKCTKESMTRLLIYAGVQGSTANKSIKISNLKFERGNKPTDWTPAPEDIESTVSTLSGTVDSVAAWCYNNNLTYIDGSKIYTGTIAASKISVTDLKAFGATIGGFSIGTKAIYNGTSSKTSTTAGIYLGTDAIRAYANANACVQIENGVLTANGAVIKNGTFSVTTGANTTSYIQISNSTYGAYIAPSVITMSYGLSTKTEYSASGMTYNDTSGTTYSHYGSGMSIVEDGVTYVSIDSTGVYSPGWFSNTYGGGWYMNDTTYLRVYGNKHLLLTGNCYFGGSTYFISSSALAYLDEVRFAAAHGVRSATTSGTWLLAQIGAGTYIYGTMLGNSTYDTVIYTKGNVWKNSSTTTYFATTSSSDRRLKEHVSDMSIYKDFFMDLKPVAFKYHNGLYNAPGKESLIQWGYYAQDVRSAFEKHGVNWTDQELVVVEDGELTVEESRYVTSDLLKMNYQNMISLNTYMIQDTRLGVDENKKRIQELESMVSKLQGELLLTKSELEQLRTVA